MKKLLALVLALVMSMSLVTISNAAYADASDIDYSEAADVMSAIGVIAGTDGNKFDPKAELTREQAAKIIAYLDLGEKTAEALVGSNTFADVPATRWSAGYVDYCAQAGYVAGVGGGNFDPTGKLTGLQFAKMLLCVLGYDASKESLTGSDWSIVTAKLASTNDLFDGIDTNPTAVFTREEAAQMALNALKADTYEYALDGTTVKGDGFEVITGGSKASKVANKISDDYRTDGSAKDTVQQLVEKLYGTDLKATEENDEFGRPATSWKYKTTDVGTYSDSADYTYTAKVTKKALYNDLGKNVYDDLKNNDADLTYWMDGEENSTVDYEDVMDKNSTAKMNGVTGNGTLTEVYVDDDSNDVTIVVINTYVVQASDSYSAKKGEVKIDFPENAEEIDLDSKTLSDDDFAIENVEEDDYLLITVADGEIKTVAAAKTVTGKVTAYSKGNDVTIGGETYKYATKVSADTKNGKNVEFTIGEDTTVVLDAYGYIIYVDEATASASNYVYIAEFAEKGDFENSSDVIADAYFVDGTHKTITVKDGDADAETGWYTYSEKKSGKFELTEVDVADVADADASSGEKITENGKTVVGNDDTFKVNKATVFVIVDDDEVKVYEGISKVPTITANAKSSDLTAYAKMDGSFAEYVFIDATDASFKNASKSATEYVYLLDFDRTGTDADENTYYQYNAIVNGEVTKIKLDDSFSTSESCNTLYEDIAYDSETGYVTDMDEVEDGDDYVIGDMTDATIDFSKGVLSFVDEYALADKYEIFLVVDADIEGINENDDDYSVTTVTGSGLKSECKGYEVDGDYVAVLNDDDEIVTLYVHISDAEAE